MKETKYYIELGLNLRRIRRMRDLTQTQLGAVIGKKTAIISKYEKAKVKPEPDVLQEIADFYGVSLNSLLPSGKNITKK